MSGGIAYVWNKDGNFERMCNTETFELESLEAADDINELQTLIENHRKYTGSTVAEHILANWKQELAHFVKVMPTDYKRVLEEMSAQNAVTAAVGS
jgi:glutamate synthase domain-containing protein 3